jgi:hypothetical protein
VIAELVKAHIAKNKTRVFRRAYIKRMELTGAFEADWQEITDDIKKFGKITQSVDTERYNKISFRSANFTVNNEHGYYLDETDEHSLWFGYASQQRTLVKIEAGFVDSTLGADGIYIRSEQPGSAWDIDKWDDDRWGESGIQFIGLVSGDIAFSSQYEVNINIMPLMEVFRQFPVNMLHGFTATGFTASQFCEFLRDQTDGAGSFVFRPFFGDTTTNWNIETTTNNYAQLNTNTSADLVNLSTWDVIQRLAEAENMLAYITNDGIFNFTSRDSNTITAAYEFFGLGVPNNEFGHTIKSINKFGRVYSKYYSQVSVQFSKDDTATSYVIISSSLSVAGNNLPWIYGQRLLEISNFWISGSTLATQIAQEVFTQVSAVKKEVEFTTCFLPGLNVLDRIYVSYDPARALDESLWDVNNWGDTTTAALTTDLIWDASRGDSFYLNSEEMNVTTVELDLDKLENKIVARET